jgi:hypothetical protein
VEVEEEKKESSQQLESQNKCGSSREKDRVTGNATFFSLDDDERMLLDA